MYLKTFVGKRNGATVQRGYSLVQLLVVMLLVSILATWDIRPRPLQNSPKSPKFPPRHLGDFHDHLLPANRTSHDRQTHRPRPLQNSFPPTAENLCLGFGCRGKGILQRSQVV